MQWIRLLRDYSQCDPSRFKFNCYPAIDIGESTVVLRLPGKDDTLEWQDHHKEPHGADVQVRYATTEKGARRVLSRGQPAADSAEAAAARLVEIARGGPGELLPLAVKLQAATDRRRLFSDAPDPVLTAKKVADALAGVDAGMAEMAVAAFAALMTWCRAAGKALNPSEWHPVQGVDRAAIQVERVDFHGTVPAGRVVIEEFGVAGTDFSPKAFVSAGPVPDGFEDVRRAEKAITDDGKPTLRFRNCVAAFARRSLEGNAGLAAPELFEIGWKAVDAAPDRDDLGQAIRAVHTFLERSYDMVTFEPKSFADLLGPADTWLQGRDGGPVRGMRIEQVIRPGLRKRDNSLVYPAIVEAR